MSITINYNNMMAHKIGDKGFTWEQILATKKQAYAAVKTVQANRGLGMQGWMDLPHVDKAQISEIKKTARQIAKSCDYFVVLGIGGSALGPTAVFTAIKHLYFNQLPKKVRKAPQFYVIDNVDPERMNALFDIIDIKKTIFNVVTKSGATSETMAQYLIVLDMLKKQLGDDYKEHVVCTTSQKRGNLIKIAQQEGFKTFYIPDGVGGRFSELCPVGLLPAAVEGIDISAMLKGAAHMDRICKKADLKNNPALITAVLQYLSMKEGKNISVMMPYADSLKYVADWYAQLWAESLGKNKDKEGNDIQPVGQTPVKALGVTDQHSQVQLYANGPFDKVVTFLEVGNFRGDTDIPEGCPDIPDVNFLCGNTLSTLLTNELFATRYALTKAKMANYTIKMDVVDEYHLGQLLYLFEMQTAYAGELLGIDTYNQPGVEEGKNATYALFGKKGYEAKAEELKNAPQDNEEFIIQ